MRLAVYTSSEFPITVVPRKIKLFFRNIDWRARNLNKDALLPAPEIVHTDLEVMPTAWYLESDEEIEVVESSSMRKAGVSSHRNTHQEKAIGGDGVALEEADGPAEEADAADEGTSEAVDSSREETSYTHVTIRTVKSVEQGVQDRGTTYTQVSNQIAASAPAKLTLRLRSRFQVKTCPKRSGER
jgi:hypothetical protein